jgi:hypothetical protein
MALVFDYPEQLNAAAVNPRTQAEIESLLLTQLWKVQGGKDGSDNLLYSQLYKNGAGKVDVHVLCPPYCAYTADNSHLFRGNSYYTEWLIVSCEEDSYLVVLHTKKISSGICVSEIDHISRKNPHLDLGEETGSVRQFASRWLRRCAALVQASRDLETTLKNQPTDKP